MAKRTPPKKTLPVTAITRHNIPSTNALTVSVSQPPPVDITRESDSPFMKKMRERFKFAATYEADLRKDHLYDLEFAEDKQWDPDVVSTRTGDRKPVLTVNYLPGFIKQVTNQARMARPSIQIDPVDNGADPDTAEVLQGIIRAIELDSDASSAYITAQEHQAKMGLGWWKVIPEFENDEAVDSSAFDQVLRIIRIRNRFSIYSDPLAQRLDKRDGVFLFETEDVSRDDFTEEYGEDMVTGLETFMSTGDMGAYWFPNGRVRIVHYWYIDIEEDVIVLLEIPPDAKNPEPTQITVSEVIWKEMQAKIQSSGLPPNAVPREIRRRTIARRTLKYALCCGWGVLDGNADKTEGRAMPGKWIPYVPVIGEEVEINGKVDYKGIVRRGRHAQRLINYWISEIAYVLGTAPKAPYTIDVGQLEGVEEWWRTLNFRNYPYLPYKGRAVDGRLLPPPQRQTAEPPIQAMVQGLGIAENALMSAIGLHEPNLGMQGNERSGKAILARQERGDLSTSNYHDNFARAIRFTGEILIDQIPYYYDAQRVMRIVGADGKTRRRVMVHGAGKAPAPDQAMQLKAYGVMGIYDLSVGRYDVSVSVGTPQSKRQQAAEAMTALVQANPNAFGIIGDLVVESMDWPGAREVADRLRRAMDPKLLGPVDPNVQIPPQVQAQMTQMAEQLQQLQQAYQQAQMMLATEAQKLAAQGRMKQMELVSEERIAAMEAKTQLAIEAAKIQSDRALTVLKAEMERITILLETRQKAIEADRAEKPTTTD